MHENQNIKIKQIYELIYLFNVYCERCLRLALKPETEAINKLQRTGSQHVLQRASR